MPKQQTDTQTEVANKLLQEAVNNLLMLPEYRVVSRSTVHIRLRDAFEHLERIHALLVTLPAEPTPDFLE